MGKKDRVVKSIWKGSEIYRFNRSLTQNFLRRLTSVADIFEDFERPSKDFLATPLHSIFLRTCTGRNVKKTWKSRGAANFQENIHAEVGFQQSCNFIGIALRHGCSRVNLLHIFRTPFPRNTSGWLLLSYYLSPFSFPSQIKQVHKSAHQSYKNLNIIEKILNI